MSDIRFAIRQLLRAPGFAFVAIATLALGIGVCTAMFGVVRAVVLKPLPVVDPGRLVWIENNLGEGLSNRTIRADTMMGWREGQRSFESLAGLFAFSDYLRPTMTGNGDPERLRSYGITQNFLPTVGVPVLLGRNFTPDEGRFQGPPAAILSHAFWQRRFGGDPSVVGRTLTLNGQATAIVGVLPRTFDFDALFTPGTEIDLLVPFAVSTETANFGNTLFGVARLKAGATPDQAAADLTAVSRRLMDTTMKGQRFGAVVQPLDAAVRGRFRTPFVVLAGAVACILAIACVNLSNLLLARMNARRQELGVRLAIGASRWHLTRQALVESAVLAGAGAAIGVPLAVWATTSLARLKTFGVPMLQDATVDPVALAVSLGITASTALACGVLPALYATRTPQAGTLRDTTHQRSAGRSAVLARNSLVVTEVALACILLVGAGLLMRSFSALLAVDLGFRPENAMAWRIDSPRQFRSGQDVDTYLGGMAAKVAAVPGVIAVGMSDTLPLGRNRTWGAGLVGETYPPDRFPVAYPRLVSPTYLAAMQIPLVEGRGFDQSFSPNAARAVIISQTLARQLSPDRSPLGRTLAVNGGSTIVGIAASVHHGSLEEAGGGEMYLDYRQSGDWSSMELVVRSSRDPQSLAADVRKALAAYDPALPTGEFYPLARLVDDAVAPRRLITGMLGGFSTMALVLAALGLYGVISYAVTQRTQEIGVRLAIGAGRGDVLGLVVRDGLRLVGYGIAIGLAGAMLLTRVLQSLLFGVSAYDPLVFIGNAGLLTLVALAACALPAVRAARVNPTIALRGA
jgi:putative ABC transport system permease protein